MTSGKPRTLLIVEDDPALQKQIRTQISVNSKPVNA